jgi:chromosome segregation ATPase
MKKKLMMVAVLLGALSLGACVDNDESASVEAVRNAKAEQLKGAAALANAQAEAETIRANAEAKLKEAEAAYQDAKTEADKAKWAAKLTVIQAEAARDIAKAQKAQKDAEMAIITNQDQWINNTLWWNYSDASDKLISLNGQLINATADEIALKAGVVSAQKAAEKIAVEKNQYIARQTERKDQLSKLSSIASDRAALEKKFETLRVEQTELTAAKGKTADAVTAAQAKFDEAQEKIYAQSGNTDKLSSALAKAGAELTYVEVEYNNQIEGFYVTTFNSVEVGENSNNAQPVNFYELNVKSQTLAFQNKIKYIKENIVGVPSDTDKGIQASGAYTNIEYWAAQKKQKEAEKAAATTDAEKAAIQAEIEALQPDIERADEALEAAKKELAEAEAEFKAFQDAVALFANADAKAAYDKDIADAKTLAEALVAASDADDAAQLPLSANRTALQDVQTLLNSTQNIDQMIADCDVQIAKAKEDIAKANSTNTIYVWSNQAYLLNGRWYPGYVVDQNNIGEDTAEALHAYMVDRIEALNAQIESQGQIVEKYKKQLDDAIAAL